MPHKLTALMLGISILALPAALSADVDVPSDFSSPLTDLAGWQSDGYAVEAVGGVEAAWSSGAQAQTLESPSLTVSEDLGIVYFTVAAQGAKGDYKFKLTVIDEADGSRRTLDNRTIEVKGGDQAVTLSRRVALKGYKGKAVRLALVNAGNPGSLGFKDVGVAPYLMDFQGAEALSTLVLTPDRNEVSLTMEASTPVSAKGVAATLELEGGPTLTATATNALSIGKLTKLQLTFPPIEGIDGRLPYAMSITPGYDGAPASKVTGELIMAEPEYPSTVLVEELTSLYCTWCPAGYAMLDYYNDKFDGRIIGSALHVDFVQADPMKMRQGDYLPQVEATLAEIAPSMSGAIPMFLVNRAQVCSPGKKDIPAMLEDMSLAQVAICRVDYDPEASAQVQVSYQTRVCYDADGCGLCAQAVVVENGLSDPEWAQTNGFSAYAMSMIEEQYGKDAAPYFEPFVGKAAYVTGLTFNEIARGAYPSMPGAPVEAGEWRAGEWRPGSLSFAMPDNVADWRNVDIILVLSQASTGEVVACTRLGAADFNKDVSGVQEEAVDARVPQGPFYDLLGRRVEHPSKGFYIYGGRKVLL